MRIAILEDDISQVELLSHWLGVAGHFPCVFSQGAQLISVLERDTFDALLLDWNVTDLSGMEVLQQVRNRLHLQVPILFCTARNSQTDLATALHAGADDYLIKPMRRMELLARLETVARRSMRNLPEPDRIEAGVFRVDFAMRVISKNSVPVTLTAKDFDLAALFFRNIGRLVSRRQIQLGLWEPEADVGSRTLDTYVSRIRRKLDLKPEQGWELSAVYGHGYRLRQLGAEDI